MYYGNGRYPWGYSRHTQEQAWPRPRHPPVPRRSSISPSAAARHSSAVLAPGGVDGPASPGRHRGLARGRVRGRAVGAHADRGALGCGVGGAGVDGAERARRAAEGLSGARRREPGRRVPPVARRSRPIRAACSRSCARWLGAPGARSVANPLTLPADAGLISRDGRTAIVPVDLAVTSDASRPVAAGALGSYVSGLKLAPGSRAEVTGEWPVWSDFNKVNEEALAQGGARQRRPDDDPACSSRSAR